MHRYALLQYELSIAASTFRRLVTTSMTSQLPAHKTPLVVMIFGKRERSRTERTSALSFDEPKGKAHNQWRLMLMFSAGWVPPLPPTLSKTWGSCNV